MISLCSFNQRHVPSIWKFKDTGKLGRRCGCAFPLKSSCGCSQGDIQLSQEGQGEAVSRGRFAAEIACGSGAVQNSERGSVVQTKENSCGCSQSDTRAVHNIIQIHIWGAPL